MSSNINPTLNADNSWRLGTIDKGIFLQKTENKLFGSAVKNLFPKQYVSEIASTVIQGVGTSTAIVKDNETQKITMSIGPGDSGRTFITTPSYTFIAGHTYAFSFEIEDCIKGSNADDYLQITGAVPTIDFGTLTLTKAQFEQNSKVAVIFQPTTSQAVTWRLGLGIGGNTNGPASTGAKLVIKNIMFEDLSESNSNIPSPYVPAGQGASLAYVYGGSLASDTAGKLEITSQVKAFEALSVAIFGDSYVNDVIDYPEQLSLIKNPQIAVWYQKVTSVGVTVGGTRPVSFLSTLKSKLQDLIDTGRAPKFVLIQSSLNTVTGSPDARATAMQEDIAIIEESAKWAINQGIVPILTTIAAWKTGAGVGWIINTVYFDQQKFDQWIYALGANLGINVFNLRAPVEDAAIPYQIAAAYDSGDGIHPNATGMALIGSALHKFILSL